MDVAQQRLALVREVERWRQPGGIGIGVDGEPGGERCGLVTAGRRADPGAAAAEVVVVLHRIGRQMVEQWMRGTSQTLASLVASTS